MLKEETFILFEYIYYIFFVFILALALAVFMRLLILSRKVAKENADINLQNPKDYQNLESFLLRNNRNFPLSALIKIIPGTFVGFGILGTFLGFSKGIAGMRLSGNVDELFGKLDTFFGGLNTAFITSIVGVILSVIFGTLLYQWPVNKIKYHCARIYNELTKNFNPTESAKLEFDTYIGSIQEMTQTLLTAKKSIETLPKEFLEVGESLEKSIQPVKDTFGAMQATLENYSKQAASLQNASEQIQLSLTKFIETSEQTTEQVNQNLEKTIEATQSIQENNAQLNADHKKMLKDYKILNENLSSIQEKINEEIETYCNSIKNQFSQLLTAYSERAREILQDQNAQMLEERKSTLSDYQQIDEKISSILETLNNNVANYSATIENTLIQTLEEYNKSAQKVTKSFFGEEK